MAINKITLGELTITVDRKAIKNIHLSVYPPDGRVHISAPERFTLDALRVYAIGRLPWIERQRQELISQPRDTPRQYISRETHWWAGQRYLLDVQEQQGARPQVQSKLKELCMTVPPSYTREQRQTLLYNFYREDLKARVPALIAKYESQMGVSVAEFRVRKMRTKWGSCNIEASRIWLNVELARKPPECLEYLVVHEMVHLLERTHSRRFRSLMDKFFPGWPAVRKLLNELPVAHVDWAY
ncbi:M48 family metallopeptidase [Neolewinella aurantiaca]|uniref:M48 family metallopeptidase n=1 Tax=Neolewinella aurantiaca TaxID=2602767 RepID=A0A5C7FHQ0_9BACT|nr:SprT family zinc-dependent metalloprotease [Neolewinella aurantiaca]TXF89331.1 M48 family metallopeptidase [Neolewinella aurantiaca]